MLRTSAALVLIAGCFAPDPTVGAPCAVGVADDLRCPSGQMCVAHDGVETCEIDDIDDPDPPGTDRDGDLIVDLLDNCPDIANFDQADEDRDLAGDLCDPCPPFQGIEDADGDGVGDACDPNPTTPGDTLVAFTGFATPLPSTWQTTGGFLASAGEGFAMTTGTGTATATFASPTSLRVEIRATGQLLAITARDTDLASINLVERYLPSTDKGIACQLSTLDDGTQQQLRIFDLDKSLIVDTAGHPIVTGAELDLRLRRTNSQYLCRATNPVLELGGSAVFAPTQPRIGLRVRGAAALFHWVMIVASP
jgi:hypothetical protein